MNEVLVVATGGTIDKEYGVGAGILNFTFGKPAAETVFSRAQVGRKWKVVRPVSKDSLELTDEDRDSILKSCTDNPHEQVVITHGTDTMVQTASVIAARNLPKTIVLTGAGQPAVMRETDADFNLGFALAVAQVAPHGVYVTMNGQAFKWNEVQKNSNTGIFESK